MRVCISTQIYLFRGFRGLRQGEAEDMIKYIPESLTPSTYHR